MLNLPIQSKTGKLSTEEIKSVLTSLTVEDFDEKFDDAEGLNKQFAQEKNWKRTQKCNGRYFDEKAIVRTFELKKVDNIRLMIYSDESDSQIVHINLMVDRNETFFKDLTGYSNIVELTEEEMQSYFSERIKDGTFNPDDFSNLKQNKEHISGGFHLYCFAPAPWEENEPSELESYLYVATDNILEVFHNEGYGMFTDDSETYLIVKDLKENIVGRYVIKNEPYQIDGEFSDDEEFDFKITKESILKLYGMDISKGYCVSHN